MIDPPSTSPDSSSALAVILMVLGNVNRQSPAQSVSLAKRSKQSGLAMSTLRRHLTKLANAQLLRVEMHEDGRGHVTLLPEGLALCAELFDSADPAQPS